VSNPYRLETKCKVCGFIVAVTLVTVSTVVIFFVWVLSLQAALDNKKRSPKIRLINI
jgi:hypothetical protein